MKISNRINGSRGLLGWAFSTFLVFAVGCGVAYATEGNNTQTGAASEQMTKGGHYWTCSCKLYRDGAKKPRRPVGTWYPKKRVHAHWCWKAELDADHLCENSRAAKNKACKCTCKS